MNPAMKPPPCGASVDCSAGASPVASTSAIAGNFVRLAHEHKKRQSNQRQCNTRIVQPWIGDLGLVDSKEPKGSRGPTREHVRHTPGELPNTEAAALNDEGHEHVPDSPEHTT